MPHRPLSRDEARIRAALVRVTGYEVDLDLTGTADGTRFTSTTTILFTCAEPGASTFVDIRADAVERIRLNGRNLDPDLINGDRLVLTDLLGSDELVVRATMACTNTGEGLHRFVDPADGEVYLYAQSFLEDARRIFVCFDQPDLKAPVRLSVTAPPEWEVRANGAGRRVGPGRWEFAETAPLATYFTALVAGPYHVEESIHDGIPLALLCRRSLAPYLATEAAEIFEITRSCLDRYHRLFGMRYPFGKYDQAFVPEFNLGAMENPGLVMFRDELVFRSAVTEAEREQRATVIAHEMAHMWFGDLVTMRWWDDLWLNESFAEYMGVRVAAEATRFTSVWTGFAVGRKAWGYAADQRPSTHPVAPTGVTDTALALLNFDGISYAKGASALRQLVAWVGDEAFLTGLRSYFAAHAHGNATLADLLAALSAASGRDLTEWSEVWLRRAQVNTLRPRTRLDVAGRYAEVVISQTAPGDHPTLRPHRIAVAVYGDVAFSDAAASGPGATGPGATGPGVTGADSKGRPAGTVELLHRVQVELDPAVDGGRTPVPELVGLRPGRLLLVNDGDLTFAKIGFDPAERVGLIEVLPRLTDPLARALAWSAATEETRDAAWPAQEFLALVAAALPTEPTVAVFTDVLRFARETVADRYLSPADRPAALAVLATACETVARTGHADLLLPAARGRVSCAGPDDVGRLADWLAGRALPDGLRLDPDLRWAVLHRMVVLGAAGEADIDAELDRDRTGRTVEHAARARAAIGHPAAKARAWATMVADDTTSARLVAATAEGFWQPEQADLISDVMSDVTAQYVARYFAEMPTLAATRTAQAVRQIATAAYPRLAVAPATVAAAEAVLARSDLAPVLRRVLVDATDDLRRAVAARDRSVLSVR